MAIIRCKGVAMIEKEKIKKSARKINRYSSCKKDFPKFLMKASERTSELRQHVLPKSLVTR